MGLCHGITSLLHGGYSQGRPHEVLTVGDGFRCVKPTYPPNSNFSSHFGNFISKILENLQILVCAQNIFIKSHDFGEGRLPRISNQRGRVLPPPPRRRPCLCSAIPPPPPRLPSFSQAPAGAGTGHARWAGATVCGVKERCVVLR